MHVWSEEMQCLGLSRSLYRLSVPHQGDKLFSVLDTDVGKSTWRGKFLPPALPSRKLELCAAPLTAAKPLGFPFPSSALGTCVSSQPQRWGSRPLNSPATGAGPARCWQPRFPSGL